MGIFDLLLGGGVDAKLQKLDRKIEESSYDDAEECLLGLRAWASPKHPPGSEAAILLDLAESRLRLKYQQLDRIESVARRAYNASRTIDDKDLQRDSTEALLGCAARAGRFKEVVDLAEQWIAVASPDFRQRVEVLITKAVALNQLGRFNDALLSFEAAIRLVDGMPDTPYKHERFVSASSGMGDAHLGLGSRAQAINCWRQAMAATRQQLGQDHPQVAAILVCIGTEQLNGDEIEHACGSFTQALEILRAAGHSESMGAAIALQKLALAHLMKGEVPRAAQLARESVQAASSHGPEMRAEAQELLRKIEDSKLVPPGMAPAAKLVKSSEPATLDDLPLMDRTMFPGRAAAARPLNRPGRTHINWAAIGR